MSAKLMPAAATSTWTSPGPGGASVVRLTASFSGPPAPVMTTCVMSMGFLSDQCSDGRVERPPVVPSYDGLHDLDAPGGGGEGIVQRGPVTHLPMGYAECPAQRAEV